MTKIAQISKSIVGAIERCDPKQIKMLLKDLPKEPRECCVNDARVAQALMKNFDVAVANILFKNGFSLFSCLSSRHSYQTGELKYSILEQPSSDFWLYACTPGRIKKSDLTAFANISVKMLAENNWSTSHPKRAALAEFRDILRQNHPKFFHEWANLESWGIYQALFSPCNKNFCAQDWTFFNFLPSLFWKDTAHPADWSIRYAEQEIPPLLNVVKNVSDAQKALEKHYKFINHSRTFAQQLVHSPTGKLEDIVLLQQIQPEQRSKVLNWIKGMVAQDSPPAYLGVSECEIFMEILLSSGPRDAILWDNIPRKIQDNLLQSQSLFFTSLPEMIIVLNNIKYLPNASEVNIEKIFSKTSVVRETVEYYCSSGEQANWTSLVKMFPDLKNWQDGYGNTLGHWIASSNQANEFMDVLKDPSWLKPNKQGYYVRDILSSTASNDNVREYDRYVSEQLAKQEKRSLEKSLNINHYQSSRRSKI